eukprot:8554414-Pyramimonas_sp.AAC.1
MQPSSSTQMSGPLESQPSSQSSRMMPLITPRLCCQRRLRSNQALCWLRVMGTAGSTPSSARKV